MLNHLFVHCWDYCLPNLVRFFWTFSIICYYELRFSYRQWKMFFHEQCLLSEVMASAGEAAELVFNLLMVWGFLALCPYLSVRIQISLLRVLWADPALCRPYGTDTAAPSHGCTLENVMGWLGRRTYIGRPVHDARSWGVWKGGSCRDASWQLADWLGRKKLMGFLGLGHVRAGIERSRLPLSQKWFILLSKNGFTLKIPWASCIELKRENGVVRCQKWSASLAFLPNPQMCS